MIRFITISLLFASLTLLTACTGTPENIQPVNNFDLSKYKGQWYEIARLDHSFEQGLEKITAQYSLNKDGSIKVVNRGFNIEEQQWDEATGNAEFVGDETLGHLKVSFFGPFYSSYVIFKLDPNYQYAYVTGYNKDYLWLLSRTPEVSKARLEDFKTTAAQLGFKTDELIFVEHSL